ncbi:hypothetical protein ACFZA1_33780 [Streptomyces filipinensis]|uniref:hypothetical protein n=1 Tax=Streptomyces filipinensis TaxID=66887 RepID=UPI0036F08280
MEAEIRPHAGVGPFQLGMPAAEVRDMVQRQRLLRAVPGDERPGRIVLTHDDARMDVVLGFTKGALSGVELFRFQNEDADVRVLFDGLDVFRTPSGDLLEQLAERGHAVEENDLGFDALPELNMILAHRGSHEHPVDAGAGPLPYDYVLLADWI